MKVISACRAQAQNAEWQYNLQMQWKCCCTRCTTCCELGKRVKEVRESKLIVSTASALTVLAESCQHCQRLSPAQQQYVVSRYHTLRDWCLLYSFKRQPLEAVVSTTRLSHASLASKDIIITGKSFYTRWN